MIELILIISLYAKGVSVKITYFEINYLCYFDKIVRTGGPITSKNPNT